jgi:hypothetical protein
VPEKFTRASRSRRRRLAREVTKAAAQGRRPSLLRTRELIAIGVAAAVTIVGLFVYLAFFQSGGDNSSEETSVTETFFPPYSPDSPEGVAIVDLARRSIEVLPRGEWPSLYDSFTPEYQQRCPREQFAAAGEAGAQEQGSNLPLLRFVNLEQVSLEGDTAKAVIVGEIQGSRQYKLRAAFRKVDGFWKISPTEGTDGCNAFDRLESS